MFTVRRGCDHCGSCAESRSNMCASGDYTEGGNRTADGFQTEYVVDTEQYVVNVPVRMAEFEAALKGRVKDEIKSVIPWAPVK